MIRVIKYSSEPSPQVGDTFVIKEIYTHEDGMYGPQVTLVLEKQSCCSSVKMWCSRCKKDVYITHKPYACSVCGSKDLRD